jgi:hypothetical protein
MIAGGVAYYLDVFLSSDLIKSSSNNASSLGNDKISNYEFMGVVSKYLAQQLSSNRGKK